MATEHIKRPDEVRVYTFDFSKFPEIADSSETLTGTPTVTTPESGLTIGSPSIGSPATKVNVQLSAGTDGTEYHLTCKCATSGGKTLVVCGQLPVEKC